MLFFFFNDTATTEIYPLSLHDALPISSLGAELGPALRPVPRRARRSLRLAGDRYRLRGPRLFVPLSAATPGARGAPGVGHRALLLLRAALYGFDGGAGDGAGPDPLVCLLGSNRYRVVLSDRLRRPQGGVAGLGTYGAPSHRDHRGAASDRGALPLLRIRDLLCPGTRPPRRAWTAPHRLWPPRRSRRASEERASAAALLATAGDGRSDAGLSLFALGGDGRRRCAADRQGVPTASEERGPARRAPGVRHSLDGG